MEQTRYWTWTRRKLSGMPHIQPFAPMAVPSYDSWEEQAFAEDAAGGLGGCVWPPRSYSCSFCRREFRSAQALGGHMNVHRRDRARLKQSSPTAPVENNRLQHQHHHHLLQYHPCPTQIGPVVGSPNPNQGVTASRSLSPSRLTLPSNQENCRENNLVSTSNVSPSIVQENSKHLFFSAPHLRTQAIPELKLGGEDLRLRVTSGKRGRDSCNEEEEILIDRSSKRQKTDEGLPSFLDLEPSDCLRLRIETIERGRSSLEELDLELRLGDRPKVKENCSGSCA